MGMKTLLTLIFSISFASLQASDTIPPAQVVSSSSHAVYGGAACSGVTTSRSWSAEVTRDSVQFTGLVPETDSLYTLLLLHKGDVLIVSRTSYTPYYDNPHHFNIKGVSPRPIITRSGNTVSVTFNESASPGTIRWEEPNESGALGVKYKGTFYALEFPPVVHTFVAMP